MVKEVTKIAHDYQSEKTDFEYPDATRLAVHGLLNRAAREAGIAYSTIRRYRKENPAYEAAIQEAFAEAVAEAEDTVFDLMRDPNVNDSVRLRAATFILRHHRSETYGKRVDVKHKHQFTYVSNVPRPQIIEANGNRS